VHSSRHPGVLPLSFPVSITCWQEQDSIPAALAAASARERAGLSRIKHPAVQHNLHYLFTLVLSKSHAWIWLAIQANLREYGARNTVEDASERPGGHLTVYWRPARMPHTSLSDTLTRQGCGTGRLKQGIVFT